MIGGRPVTGRMVLFGMLAFFGIIFAANGALVFYALESWPGLTTDKAYQEGIDYNRTLDAAAVQARLGWTSAVVFAATEKPASGPWTGQVRLSLTGRGNAPVTGMDVRVRFRRPVKEGADVTAILMPTAPGRYAAPVGLPLAGRWYADIDAGRNGKTVYRMRHELMVKP